MAFTKNQLIYEINNALSQMRMAHDIQEAYLFGSYAKGNPKEYSDVDIAIILGSLRNDPQYDESFEIFHKMQNYNSLFEVICFQQDKFSDEEVCWSKILKTMALKSYK